MIQWLWDAVGGTRTSTIKAPLVHLPLEVRRDESQIGPAALTPSELPTSQELIPFNASSPGRRFPERKSPNGKHSQHVFFHLYSWMFNEPAQVKIRVKCRMYYSSAGPPETWTDDLLFISRFLLLLMDTVDGLEVPLQLHVSIWDCNSSCFPLSTVAKPARRNKSDLTFNRTPVASRRRMKTQQKTSDRERKSQRGTARSESF